MQQSNGMACIPVSSTPWLAGSHARRLRTKSQSSLYLIPCCPLFQTLQFLPLSFAGRACRRACGRPGIANRLPLHMCVHISTCQNRSCTPVVGLATNKCSVGKFVLRDHKRCECVLSGSRESTLPSTDKKYQTTYSH